MKSMINLTAFKAFHRRVVQQKQLDKDFQNLKTKLHNFSRTDTSSIMGKVLFNPLISAK